jgi:hypothetical protein
MAGKRYLEGIDGGQSSMRLVWAFTMIIAISVWAIISLTNMKMEGMSEGFVILMIALSGTKVAQNMVEKGNLSLKIGDKKNPDAGEPAKPIVKPPQEDSIKPPKE